MKSLSALLKLQFFVGFVGALVWTPLLYVVELFRGDLSSFASSVWMDLLMAVVGAFILGGVFLLMGLAAYPVLRFLQRRGLVQDLFQEDRA